jgi:hypothetical protein
MNVSFEATMTEADFKRPLLDAAEERLVRELNRDADLHVDGLGKSLLGWVANLVAGRSR